MKKILLCFIASFALLHAYNQAGSLDPSFAGKGWTAADFLKGNVYDEHGEQVLVQSDGHYIVLFEVNGYTLLARYCRNGDMDTRFGTGGYSDPVPIFQSKAVLQSNGKIVVAGQAGDDFALARYNTNGSLDNSFDGDGKLTTDFNSNYDYATSLAIQADGKIVVAGWTDNSNIGNPGITDFALARYNSNGSLDNSFSEDGRQTTDFFGSDDLAYALAIQPDGKIVVAGGAYNLNLFALNYDFALARYNSNGSLDSSFDGDGKQTTDFFNGYLAIQTNEKIVVAGQANGDFALAHYNSNGALDNSLDGDGSQNIGYLDDDFAYALAIQADGKIVVAGQSYNRNATQNKNDFALARYNTNGSLDNTFGKQTTDFFGSNDYAYSLAIQRDGKIVVAGQATNPNTGNTDFALARYNSNGALDNSFDVDGKQTTDFNGFSDYASSLAIQADGKIVVAGQAITSNTYNYDFALARYNSNGSLDNSFSGDGKQTGFYLAGNTGFTAIAIQADGKIVVAGQAINPNTDNSDFVLVRYNSNGSLDYSFGVDGKLTTDFNGGNDYATSLAIQADGKIVVAGQADNSNTGNTDFALARYNSNGTLDNTFDGDGKLTTDFLGGDDNASSLAIQRDGKIVVAGQASGDFAIARYNSNGSLDHSFSGDGKQTTDFNGGNDYAYALAIQPNWKIVVVGYATVAGYEDFALARYNSNGTLDNSFDGDGKQTTDFLNPDNGATSLAIQTDGKIVAAGWGYNPNIKSIDFALARYNSNGSLDNSFDEDGIQTTDFNGGYDQAYSLAIQADGKIVLAGYTYNHNTYNSNFAIARYNSNGSLDNSFSGDGKQTTDFNGGNDYAAAVAIRNNRIYVAGYSRAAAIRGIVAAYQTGTTSLAAPAIASIAPLKVPQPLMLTPTVSVLPNPSTQYFTLKLQSRGSNSTVTVSITDAGGRLIEMKNNVNANSSLQLGQNYPPGIYFAQIVQGNKKEVVKLIKE